MKTVNPTSHSTGSPSRRLLAQQCQMAESPKEALIISRTSSRAPGKAALASCNARAFLCARANDSHA